MSWIVGVSALVALRLVVLLALNGRWGYHRDEPYYIVCGRHLSWGYIDHPPLTPALARLSNWLFRDSLTGFRLLPVLASTSLMVVTAATARQLGASGQATVLAALAAMACPMFLVSGHWFQTVPFDQLFGGLVMLIWVHLLLGGDPLWWIALGILVGLGLQTKWTMLLVAGVVVVGTLASSELRPDLLTPWPWTGLILAFGMFVPNLLWQQDRGWPTLTFIRNNSSAYRNEEGWSAIAFQQIGVLGIPLLVLTIAGWVWAWQENDLWPAAFGIGVGLLGLAVIGAKPYYHGPFLPLLFAAGAVGVDGWVETSQQRAFGAIAIAAWGLVALPFILPVLSPRRAASLGIFDLNKELAEELGWPELVDQVAKVINDLPVDEQEDVTVVTRSYGEAAAIELLGPERGIPPGTALSGQNSYVDWWPDDRPLGTVVAVWFDPVDLTPFFEKCERMTHVHNDLGVKTKVAGAPIVVCRGLQGSTSKLREAVTIVR